MNWPILSIVIWLPIAGGIVVMLLGSERAKLGKQLALGVSIITFLFLSYVPDPTDDPEVARVLAADELTRLRRERFLDLPRFINTNPRDVRARAEDALAALAAGGPEAERARHEAVAVRRCAKRPREPPSQPATACSSRRSFAATAR